MADAKSPVDLSMFRSLSERTTKAVPVGLAAVAELSRFVEDPNNPRTEFDSEEFQEFVKDIAQHGVLQPVVVVPTGSGQLMIRWGARRLRAARELGLATLAYVLQTDERQSNDFAQVSENEQRASLSPMDLARFVERMIGKGMQKKDVAARLRKRASDITHLLSLATAPGFILELYSSGKCRQPEYLYELRKLWEKHPKRVAKCCAELDVIVRSSITDIRAKVEADAGALIERRPPPASRATLSAKVTVPSEISTSGSLMFEGQRHRIVKGVVVLVGDDGTEREFTGRALLELMLATVTG
jgi:ParB/RepB/Spo0J family partition protein